MEGSFESGTKNEMASGDWRKYLFSYFATFIYLTVAAFYLLALVKNVIALALK